MWWIIIIGIILFIIIKFAGDTNKQANAVAKQGGMRNKYRTLVNYALSGHKHSRIISEDGTGITIGCGSPGGSTYIDIVQTFGTVTVRWQSKSILLGNHKLEWEFDEFMDQEKMIEKIENDIDVYMTNVIQKFS